jgi:hypothetical protein
MATVVRVIRVVWTRIGDYLVAPDRPPIEYRPVPPTPVEADPPQFGTGAFGTGIFGR